MLQDKMRVESYVQLMGQLLLYTEKIPTVNHMTG